LHHKSDLMCFVENRKIYLRLNYKADSCCGRLGQIEERPCARQIRLLRGKRKKKKKENFQGKNELSRGKMSLGEIS
jgi:hypothetical protein